MRPTTNACRLTHTYTHGAISQSWLKHKMAIETKSAGSVVSRLSPFKWQAEENNKQKRRKIKIKAKQEVENGQQL